MLVILKFSNGTDGSQNYLEVFEVELKDLERVTEMDEF